MLEKIRDPESNPTAGVIIDQSLPRDPIIVDASVYERVVEKERQIIQTIQKLEIDLSKSMSDEATSSAIDAYKAFNRVLRPGPSRFELPSAREPAAACPGSPGAYKKCLQLPGCFLDASWNSCTHLSQCNSTGQLGSRRRFWPV